MAMETPIKINHLKQNDIDFELEVEGDAVADEPYEVRFVIQTSDLALSFPCVVIGKKCTVKIPVLDFLDRTTFNYRIEVIVDGYFFEASKGIVTVVGTSELYTTQPKVKLSSGQNTESKDGPGGRARKSQNRMDKKEESAPGTDKAEKTKKVKEGKLLKDLVGSSTAEDIAKSIMKGDSLQESAPAPLPNGNAKDSKVKEILSNIAAIRSNPGKAAIRKGAVITR